MKVDINRLILKGTSADITTRHITNVIQCKICYNILINPYDCQCCYQTFCGACIKSYIKTNNHCPFSEFFSNNPFPKAPLSLLKKSSSNITQLISNLKFKCRNHLDGCKTELSIDCLTEHEKNCSMNNSIPVTIMETPPTYKCRGKEMSFRNIESIDKDSSSLYNSPSITMTMTNEQLLANSVNQRQLNEKVDKIYEMLTNLVYNNKGIESTPKFDKTFMLNSPESLYKDNKGQNEPLFNIANKLTALNEKISSIESKISHSNSTADSAGSVNKKRNDGDEGESVSMFDNYMLNSISIGTNYMDKGVKNKPMTLLDKINKDKERKKNKIATIKNQVGIKVNQSFSGKSKIFQRQIKSLKAFEAVNNTIQRPFKKQNTEINMSIIEDTKQTLLQSERDNHTLNLNSNKNPLPLQYKNEILSFIEDKCNKELKQYILELTLDNSNLFVQKIDEVLDKISTIKA